MVQEYLNLDDAASALGISKEELNRKAQRREIRAFADRGTWKFRKQDIEEHSRQAGIGSGAEIVFGDLDDELPALDSGSSDQILLNEQAIADSPGGSGARIIGMDEHGRTPSDSDVRLVPETSGKKGSDSDVKLVGGLKPPSDSDVKVVATPQEGSSDSDVKIKGPAPGDSDVRLDRAKAPSDSGIRISPDALPAGASGATDVTQDLPVFTGLDDEELAIKSGSSDEQPVAAEFDSDFELTQAESDFELKTEGEQDEVSSDSGITLALDDNIGLAPVEKKSSVKSPSDSDVTAGSPSASGVSLASPADSGIALDEPPSRSGRGLGATEPPKPASDIFETDFEVPVLDSDDELAVASSSSGDTEQLGADSDFELSGSDAEGMADADSSSQVLSLEGEEPVDESAATSLGPAPAVDDEQWEEELEGGGVEAAEGGFIAESGSVPSRADSAEDAMPAPAMVTAAAGEAEWPTWIFVTVIVNTLIMLVLGMVMFDMVRTMWGWEEGQFLFYQSPILNWMKDLLPK